MATTNVGSHGPTVVRTITYHPYADGTKLCNWWVLLSYLLHPLKGDGQLTDVSMHVGGCVGDNSRFNKQDCVTVKNKQFSVTLAGGESKLYFPA